MPRNASGLCVLPWPSPALCGPGGCLSLCLQVSDGPVHLGPPRAAVMSTPGVSWGIMVGIGCQLATPGKREPQLRISSIKLDHGYVWGAFSLLLVDAGGPAPPPRTGWVPFQARWAWDVEEETQVSEPE